VDSTEAYQGVARGLGIENVRALNRVATGGLMPDLTVLIRVDPARALGRAKSADRFEAEGVEFQQLVTGAYEAIARREPERFVAVDGDGTPEEVHARVLDALRASGAGAPLEGER
jgi:dTMP kinase